MEDKNVYNELPKAMSELKTINELPKAMSIITTIIVQWLKFGNEKQGLGDQIRDEER